MATKIEMRVKCVTCGKQRQATAAEMRSVEGPRCDECGCVPMVLVQAKSKP